MAKPAPVDKREQSKIETGLRACLTEVIENCQMDFPGVTKHTYMQYGEVFNLVDGGKVHVLPGMDEIITVSRGSSIFTLTRSHAAPTRINFIWRLTVKRSPQAAIKYTKAHHIHEDTPFIVGIFQSEVGPRLSDTASDLIAKYTGARLRWRNGLAVDSAVKMASDDLFKGGPSGGEVDIDVAEEEPKNPDRSIPEINL